MPNDKLDDIIAERTLTYTVENKNQDLLVKLGRPRQDPKPGGDWECSIQVGDKVLSAFGVDSYQALSLALQLISIEVQFLRRTQGLNLEWLGTPDLGLEPIRK